MPAKSMSNPPTALELTVGMSPATGASRVTVKLVSGWSTSKAMLTLTAAPKDADPTSAGSARVPAPAAVFLELPTRVAAEVSF